MQHSILIVEDEKALANTWKLTLEAEGYQADVALDGEQGWQQWQTHPYNAVLLDMKMPRLGGGDLLERIHQRQPASSAGPALSATSCAPSIYMPLPGSKKKM